MDVGFCCEFCDREIYRLGVPYNDDIRKLFPYLCESCAEKIDRVVDLTKDQWLKQIDILDRNSKINEARKGLLGTKR